MASQRSLPLFQSADPDRPLLWSDGRVITLGEFARSVASLAGELPNQRYLVNLCERRHYFLIAYCAAIVKGQTNLLPSSRAREAVDHVLRTHSGSYACDDAMVARAADSADTHLCDTVVPFDHIALIGFTSGSTGEPKAHIKRWAHCQPSNALNAASIRECLEPKYGVARPWIVATVPPQHMYGVETSVLLPLAADMAIHGGRPLFPADVAKALSDIPEPRVLVSTPVHLRALIESSQSYPDIGVVMSATAPMDAELAKAIEQRLNTIVLEAFGSTETCIIATRRTAHEETWRLYQGVTLEPSAENTLVCAPWFDAPTVLQDIVELRDAGRFVIRGRNVDLIEVAGKRASLADLTRQVLNIPGVEDAAVFQQDVSTTGAVRRVAALVVASKLTAEEVSEHLRDRVDPVFIPRPLLIVPRLPRNELGKMPRAQLLAMLASGAVNAVDLDQ